MVKIGEIIEQLEDELKGNITVSQLRGIFLYKSKPRVLESTFVQRGLGLSQKYVIILSSMIILLLSSVYCTVAKVSIYSLTEELEFFRTLYYNIEK
jgi:hypothetical protein